MSTLRGHLGGTLLAIPILILYGLWNGETIWLMAVGICLYIAVFGRIISILKDGFEKTTAMPLAFEFIIASLVTAYHLASIS
jgi:hypothetical protein